jgi:uncharacterized protein (TIGR02466 family)|tara:strand:- start:545 stop:1063 length:519 start_codon:yes stop_codon:yes gene_type:complete
MVPKLEQYAYEQEKYKSGRNVSNIGGHQTNFITIEEEPLYKELVNLLIDEIRGVVVSMNYHSEKQITIGKCWININRKGHLNMPHIHPNTDFAGIYFIKTDSNTPIGFKNPDPMIQQYEYRYTDYNAYNTEGHIYHPKDNDFIMFPSHIPHWVDENKTDIPRISLAFNIKIA